MVALNVDKQLIVQIENCRNCGWQGFANRKAKRQVEFMPGIDEVTKLLRANYSDLSKIWSSEQIV